MGSASALWAVSAACEAEPTQPPTSFQSFASSIRDGQAARLTALASLIKELTTNATVSEAAETQSSVTGGMLFFENLISTDPLVPSAQHAHSPRSTSVAPLRLLPQTMLACW